MSIIYSVYVPTVSQIEVIHEILEVGNILNEKVYIGLQKDSCKEAIDLLNEKEVKWAHINPETYINSDVPGFQAALNLYHTDEKVNDKFIYFGHSKGVTTGFGSMRQFLLEDVFMRHPLNKVPESYGSYGYCLSPINLKSNYNPNLDRWNPHISGPHLNYFYPHTFYVIRQNIIDNFLKNINPAFFTTNLCDRYFFERDFIHIVDKQGYEPCFRELVWNNGWGDHSPSIYDYNNIIDAWRRVNESK